MITDALRNGEFDFRAIRHLLNRGAEALRVIGMCLLVLAVAGFPSGNRTRTKLPLEPLIVVVAFLERGISAYSPLGSGTGAVLLIVIAVALLAYRLWPRRIGVGVAA
ncbi:hypothetical protein [Devosia aurantiaca]|uniref:Uncharacterized protein n=1 Tax=Devosia aurantiaca TaxID=2714858 RepID=A0A6M1SXF3_9HYPH|nr:hypothetical protein [Devosia aurantiaca]NGP18973.1 hypothetical protein [Devosia aurantiaca]